VIVIGLFISLIILVALRPRTLWKCIILKV
jgi:hypothetical protein